MVRLGGFELRKKLPADLLEDLRSITLAVLQVEDDVVAADATETIEEAKDKVSTASKAEMDRLRLLVWIVGQIDVKRLSEGLENARGRCFNGGTPGRRQI